MTIFLVITTFEIRNNDFISRNNDSISRKNDFWNS